MQNAPLAFLYTAGILNYSGHSGLSAVDSEQSGCELGGSAGAWTVHQHCSTGRSTAGSVCGQERRVQRADWGTQASGLLPTAGPGAGPPADTEGRHHTQEEFAF